jgi:hypothetical protein
MMKSLQAFLTSKCTDLRSNWKSAKWWRGVYRRRVYSNLLDTRGTYVIDEKWDNLILLDACRFDIFRELNRIQGKLESRRSRGSCSLEFLRENFIKHPSQSRFEDVVYVAGNPYVSLLLQNRFHKIYPVWDYGWDNDLGTVRPKPVVEAAVKARSVHPTKRLIIHFMQPHFPSLSGRLPSETGVSGLRDHALKKIEYKERTVEDLLEEGELTREEVWALYKRNLEAVLPYTKTLTETLCGLTVVTSDHGDLFGERLGILYPFREYGHKCQLHVRQLIDVPWLVIEEHLRRIDERTESQASHLPQQDEEKIKDRLRRLGYE